MFDQIGRPFFATLAREAENRLGAEHPCTRALSQAAAAPVQAAVAEAQARLTDLPEGDRDAILTHAQATLRSHPALLADACTPRGRHPSLH